VPMPKIHSRDTPFFREFNQYLQKRKSCNFNRCSGVSRQTGVGQD
jgi:hypothetical protein